MARAPTAAQAPVLRVATVWGTTVLELRTLRGGESFSFVERAAPEGLELPEAPIRSAQAGWEIDARGTKSGLVRLRGRDEDPVALGRSGAGVPIVPGDYGVLQYGLFAVFFQYAEAATPAKRRATFELLPTLAIVSSIIFHFGTFGMFGALATPPAIPKPLELTSPEEFASRFRIKRAEVEPEVPAAGPDKASGPKDPGLKDKKPAGGEKAKSAEGKLGKPGDRNKTELPGEVKASTNLGGLSEVLDSTTGREIRSTLETIKSVSDALGGLNAKDIVLGGGTGMGLKGGGTGGGGATAGVPFGAGNLATGGGVGAGGPGRAGAGGPGRGGPGGQGGGGTGGPAETKVAVTAAAPASDGGLSKEQVRRVVFAHQNALRACYESEVQRNPNLKGGVAVSWHIEAGGSVTAAQVLKSTLNNPRVEGCVLRQIRSWKFPSATGPTNVMEYPLKFGVGGG